MHVVVLAIVLMLAQAPTLLHAGALHDAAKAGDVAAITAALDAGANINESDGQTTPLYLAVRGERFEAAKLLLDRGADVNAAPTPGLGTALMPALAKRRVDLIKLLLERGANPNAFRNKENALHIAVRSGCLDCVEALLDHGADANATTKDGKPPLHLAKLKGEREVADLLILRGAVIPTPAPISDRLASADVKKGRAHFERLCHGCHSVDPDGGTKTGPTLWGVVGRDKASIADVNYSDALQELQGVWTYEDLNKFLLGPMLTTPGVFMEVPGAPDETERTHIIAYLRTLSDKPIPLP